MLDPSATIRAPPVHAESRPQRNPRRISHVARLAKHRTVCKRALRSVRRILQPTTWFPMPAVQHYALHLQSLRLVRRLRQQLMQCLLPAAPVAVQSSAPRGILTVCDVNLHPIEMLIKRIVFRMKCSEAAPVSRFLHNRTDQEGRLVPGALLPMTPCLQHPATHAATR